MSTTTVPGWELPPAADVPLRFLMFRDVDVTGVSGPGLVAEGVLASTGRCVLFWRTGVKSVGVFDHLDDIANTSGHNGATRIEWLDAT